MLLTHNPGLYLYNTSLHGLSFCYVTRSSFSFIRYTAIVPRFVCAFVPRFVCAFVPRSVSAFVRLCLGLFVRL